MSLSDLSLDLQIPWFDLDAVKSGQSLSWCRPGTDPVPCVQAEESVDPERCARLSRRSRNLSIISILTWVALLALIPCLMALVSYLLTLKD